MGLEPIIDYENPKQVLTLIPKNWPITVERGQVVIPLQDEIETDKGKIVITLLSVILKGLRTEDKKIGEAAIKGVKEYVDTLNIKTQEIANKTNIVSKPEILMSPPNERTFQDKLGWTILKTRLEASGATITEPTGYNKKDTKGVWTRDLYVLSNNGKLIFQGEKATTTMSPRDEKGIEESVKLAKTLENGLHTKGLKTQKLTYRIEGGDVRQSPDGKTVYVGVYADSNGKMEPGALQAAQEMVKELGKVLVPIPKSNPGYYHLDTFFAVLPGGEVMVMEDGTDKKTIELLKENIPAEKLLVVRDSPTELTTARRQIISQFPLNIITVNGNVFASAFFPEEKMFLEKHGYTCCEGPHKIRDSGPHCQTNFLNPGQPKQRDPTTDTSKATPKDQSGGTILTNPTEVALDEILKPLPTSVATTQRPDPSKRTATL